MPITYSHCESRHHERMVWDYYEKRERPASEVQKKHMIPIGDSYYEKALQAIFETRIKMGDTEDQALLFTLDVMTREQS